MSNLEGFSRKIADLYLHSQIQQLESLPNMTQVNFSAPLDLLLAEVLKMLSTKPTNQPNKKPAIPEPAKKKSATASLPDDKNELHFMPMIEAARQIYDQSAGTRLRTFLDDTYGSPDKILLRLANHVALSSIPIFGVHPPGRKMMEIPKSELPQLQFRDAGNSLWYHGENNHPQYTDLSIKSDHLLRALDELKTHSKNYNGSI